MHDNTNLHDPFKLIEHTSTFGISAQEWVVKMRVGPERFSFPYL